MKISTAARNAAANAVCALLNNGYLRFYNGTVPANPQAALSGNTLLAELRFNATAFANAVAGVATANAFTADSSADATGVPTFARGFAADGTTAHIDFTCAATPPGSGADIILTSAQITAGNVVEITSLTYTQPE